MSNPNVTSTNSDESNPYYDQWHILEGIAADREEERVKEAERAKEAVHYASWNDSNELEESQSTLEQVKEQFDTPVGRQIADTVTASLIIEVNTDTILDDAKDDLDDSDSSEAASFYAEATLPEAPSIFWVNDTTLQVTVGGQATRIPADIAGNPDTYRDLGISEEDTQILLDKFTDLTTGPRFDDVPVYVTNPMSSEVATRVEDTSSNDGAVERHTYTNEEIAKIREENNAKINQIVAELELKPDDDIMTQLANCLKVQQYIVNTNTYDARIMDEKTADSADSADAMHDIDLHRGLIEGRSVCSSNSVEFQSILERVGVNVKCVALSHPGSSEVAHMANLVEISGQFYYFDTTLEQSIYNDAKHANPGQALMFCVAGLGREEYEQAYWPVGVVTSDMRAEPIPDNIANTRIPPVVVNSLLVNS